MSERQAPVDPAATAIQDLYPEEFAWCYGCGRRNSEGHRLKSYWDGDRTVARFTPQPYHLAVPGFVSGGLLASLVDCHATGTASAAADRAAGHPYGVGPLPRFVTASLRVEYLRPTPLGPELVLYGRAVSLSERKVTVEVSLHAGETQTVRGEVLCALLPASMAEHSAPGRAEPDPAGRRS